MRCQILFSRKKKIGSVTSCKLSPLETICKLSPLETICMKCQILFSLKNITNLSSAESVHSMVNVKTDRSEKTV